MNSKIDNNIVQLTLSEDEIESTSLHSFDCLLYVRIGSEKHDFEILATLLDLRKPEKALVAGIDVSMEVHVEQDHIRTEVGKSAHQLLWRRNQLHLREMHRQEQLQRRPDAVIVVNNQYFCFAFCPVYFR